MNSSLRIAFLVGALSTAATSVFGRVGHDSRPEPTLSIHLYNPAQVPDGVLRSAIIEAARLFRPAGIRITWEQLRGKAPEEQPYLVVQLLRHTPATLFPGALGFSLPGTRSSTPVKIFYDRVEALAWSISTAVSVILGYTIAHEIGHVLLGSSEHSANGLMQARWDRASWYSASKGQLAFRPEEAKRIGTVLQRKFSFPVGRPSEAETSGRGETKTSVTFSPAFLPAPE